MELQRPGLVGKPHCPALVSWATLSCICKILFLVGSLAYGDGSIRLSDGDPRRILFQQPADLYITGLQELLLLLVPR